MNASVFEIRRPCVTKGKLCNDILFAPHILLLQHLNNIYD